MPQSTKVHQIVSGTNTAGSAVTFAYSGVASASNIVRPEWCKGGFFVLLGALCYDTAAAAFTAGLSIGATVVTVFRAPAAAHLLVTFPPLGLPFIITAGSSLVFDPSGAATVSYVWGYWD